jgi:hypothetical protein
MRIICSYLPVYSASNPRRLESPQISLYDSDVAIFVYPWLEIKFRWRIIFVNKEPALTVIMSREIRRQET